MAVAVSHSRSLSLTDGFVVNKSPHEPSSDGSLIRSIRKGDGAAANDLFDRYIGKHALMGDFQNVSSELTNNFGDI